MNYIFNEQGAGTNQIDRSYLAPCIVESTVSIGITVPDRIPRITCMTPFLIGIFDSELSIAAVNGREFSGRPINVTAVDNKV